MKMTGMNCEIKIKVHEYDYESTYLNVSCNIMEKIEASSLRKL
jgi:hypothetical protein